MRDPHGYATIIDPSFSSGNGVQEFDTLSCIHCGRIDMTANKSGKLEVLVFRADGTHYMKEAGFCRSCYKPICPICDGKPCSNRFKRLDEQEAAARKFTCS